MTVRSIFSPIIRSQEKGIVSSTKTITNTSVSAKQYKNNSERITKNTTIIAHYTMETMSKLNVTSLNSLKAIFQ